MKIIIIHNTDFRDITYMSEANAKNGINYYELVVFDNSKVCLVDSFDRKEIVEKEIILYVRILKKDIEKWR